MLEDIFTKKDGCPFIPTTHLTSKINSNQYNQGVESSLPPECYKKNEDVLEYLKSSNPNFKNLDFNEMVNYLQNESHIISQVRNEEKKYFLKKKYFNIISNITDNDDLLFSKISDSVDECYDVSHSMLQSNKVNGGLCTQFAVAMALCAHGISCKNQTKGIDIIVKNKQNEEIVGICIKRTGRERPTEDFPYVIERPDLTFCYVLQIIPDYSVICKILEWKFHLFLPDDDFPDITHPNLRRRSTMPDFLRSLGAATI